MAPLFRLLDFYVLLPKKYVIHCPKQIIFVYNDIPMQKHPKNYVKFAKFFLGIFACLLVRLIPFRVPNIEPIMATTMPFGRAYGALTGFSFAALSIFLYDLLTGTVGMQTFFTVGAYGAIGIWSASYFKNKTTGAWSYVKFAIMATLFYDALTGLTVGPIFFHQSLLASILGQIPFTMLHLVGNIAFAFILSPTLYNFLIKKKKRETRLELINILNPKII